MTKEEKDNLQIFCDKVSELENSNAIKKQTDNTRILLRLREEDGKPVNYVRNIPEAEDQYKLITIIRQLIMSGEKIHYYHICNILLKNQLESENVKKLKSYWTEILKPSQRQIGMFYDDEMLTNEEIINIFLYGGFVHTKDEKTIKQYQDFKAHMGDFFEFWMFNVIYDLAEIAIRTKDFIIPILDKA